MLALKRVVASIREPATQTGRYVGLEHVEPRSGALAPSISLESADLGTELQFARGDVLFGKLRPYLAKSFLASFAGVCSSEFLVLRAHALLEPRFLAYLIRSDAFIEWTVSTSDGAKMPRTDWDAVGAFPFCLPGPAEQRRIADFLDSETARIDRLVALRERLLSLLDERIRSLAHAAAAGLLTSPLVPRSRSRVPWIDSQPDLWAVVKLTHVARLGSCHTPSRSHPEWWVDCRIPWITTGEVAALRLDRVDYITKTREMISQLGLANSSAVLHPAGTVVLSRTASAGFSAIMGTDMATSQDFATWTCGPSLRPRFLLLCLRAMRGDLLGRLAMGSTHQTIYMPDLESIRIPMPPVRAQDEIVQVFDTARQRTVRLYELYERQIALLRERRSALITAAVGRQPAVAVA